MFDSLLSMVNGDGLAAAASRVIEANLEPYWMQVRGELLKRITGTPPATFAPQLAARGIPVGDAEAQALWSAMIAALADAPAAELAACK